MDADRFCSGTLVATGVLLLTVLDNADLSTAEWLLTLLPRFEKLIELVLDGTSDSASESSSGNCERREKEEDKC